MTGILSYSSQLTPVLLFYTEKQRSNSLALVFNMAFPTSPLIVLAVLFSDPLGSLRNQFTTSFQWLLALKSHYQSKPIAAQPNSAVQLKEYTHKCTGECKSVNGNVCHEKSPFSKPPYRILMRLTIPCSWGQDDLTSQSHVATFCPNMQNGLF